ncbi:hypothetical protein Anas_07914, partial [Armadillidium nasatum]
VTFDSGSPNSPVQPSPVNNGDNSSLNIPSKPPPCPEKRKRKRSRSSDHSPPRSPPPPPPPASLIMTSQPPNLLGTQGVQTSTTSIRQLPSIGPSLTNSSMKITVTGGMTRSNSAGSGPGPSSSSTTTQQKVILVSTSAASGTVGNIYQRSISVPILKSPQTNISNIPTSILGGGSVAVACSGQVAPQSSILKGAVTTPTTSGSSIINKIRPRYASSILSQGSSSLPGLPPRPAPRGRSNSLVLQSEENNNSTSKISGGSSFSQSGISSSDIPGFSSISSSNHLNIIGPNSVQMRHTSSGAQKSNVQVKQEGGKLLTHTIVSGSTPGSGSNIGNISNSNIISATTAGGSSSVAGSRIIGRTSIPNSSQGLYVVSTSSGTITVVTRTVASASVSNPRVVTVNTVNSSRPSIVRGSSSPSVLTVGSNQKSVSTMRQTGSIRPVISGPKSNVIVVHKGTIGAGTRPVGLQGLRDLSAKIIKPTAPGISSNIGGHSGILSGTLVVKPSTSTKVSSIISSTKDIISTNGTSFVSSSVTTTASSSGNNVIVVDFNESKSSVSTQNPTVLTHVVHAPSAIPSTSVRNPNSLFSSTTKSHSEASSSTLQKRESSSSSHDISTVSASSSLPSTFRVIKSPSLSSDLDEAGFEGAHSDLQHRTGERTPNLVTSSSDIKDSMEDPDEGERKLSSRGTRTSLSLEPEEDDVGEEDEEDNDWLKLGLDDEDEVEMEDEIEDEDEDKRSEGSSDAEKSNRVANKIIENEADVVEGSSKDIEDDDGNEVSEGKHIKPGTSGEASVSSSTGTEKEGELQILVQKAIEETFSLSNIAGVSSSSAIQARSDTPLSSSTPLRDESSLGSMSELDPASGYFYSPAGENSSEPTSNKADSPSPKDDEYLPDDN